MLNHKDKLILHFCWLK